MKIQERRREERFKLVTAVAHAKFVLGRDIQLKVDPASKSRDLSSSGILFHSTILYEVGDMIRLEIPLYGWEKFKTEFTKPGAKTHEPVIVLGKVVYVLLVEGGYQVGVHFIGIDADHQQALRKYLNLKRTV